MKIRQFFCAAAILLLMIQLEISGGFGLQIRICYNEELGEDILCGTYEVMENRQVRKGAKIRLNFIILPAWTDNPAPDPVFIFSGGPGAGSADCVVEYARVYYRLRFEREIVLLDQRGTGKSNPLYCQKLGGPDHTATYLQDMYQADYVRNCRKELEKKANLRYYHSTIAAQDCDDLRDVLGYERINLLGSSYGALAAVVYMKYYPERVRSAVFHSPGLPDRSYVGTLASNTQFALERLLSDCAHDPDCSQDYPQLQARLNLVMSRLSQGPVSVNLINPWTGQPETVFLNRNSFTSGIRSLLYSAGKSRWIPAFIYWAAQGNFAPIAEYTARYLRDVNEGVMDGMYLSVTCSEDIPLINYSEALAQAKGTFMGTYRLDQQIGGCDLWVRGDPPDNFHELPRSDVPALIISGEIDPVTPPSNGEALASGLPNSIHVIIPQAGHEYGQVWEGCLEDALVQFIAQGHTAGIETSCAAANQRPPFISWKDYVSDPLPENSPGPASTQNLQTLKKRQRK